LSTDHEHATTHSQHQRQPHLHTRTRPAVAPAPLQRAPEVSHNVSTTRSNHHAVPVWQCLCVQDDGVDPHASTCNQEDLHARCHVVMRSRSRRDSCREGMQIADRARCSAHRACTIAIAALTPLTSATSSCTRCPPPFPPPLPPLWPPSPHLRRHSARRSALHTLRTDTMATSSAAATPEYTLHYFDIAGRAEPIRQAFAIAGVPFTYRRIAFKEWPAIKASGLAPYDCVPLLEVRCHVRTARLRSPPPGKHHHQCVHGCRSVAPGCVPEVECCVGAHTWCSSAGTMGWQEHAWRLHMTRPSDAPITQHTSVRIAAHADAYEARTPAHTCQALQPSISASH
jgi:hypothetical protein